MDYPVGDYFFRRVDAVGLVGKIFFYIIPADMVLKKPYLVLCKIAELYENYAFWAICQNVIKCSIMFCARLNEFIRAGYVTLLCLKAKVVTTVAPKNISQKFLLQC